jgi:hypothetical protein
MLFGILSVVAATSQHYAIGLINHPTALRLWLSRGKPSIDHRTEGSEAYPHPYDTLPLESSISASLSIRFPRILLNIAVLLYLIGFSLYLIFSWREEVPNGSADYRNIFIVFIISTGFSIFYYGAVFVARVYDSAKVSADFHFQRLGATLDGSEGLQELEATLGKFHQEKDLVSEVRKLTIEVIKLRQSLQGATAEEI